MVIEQGPFKDNVEQIQFLNQISVFAHSSQIGESFGNTIAESMAAGLATIILPPLAPPDDVVPCDAALTPAN